LLVQPARNTPNIPFKDSNFFIFANAIQLFSNLRGVPEEAMMQKVLLTGASGAVGFEAFQELLRRKDRYAIRILSLDTIYERNLFKPHLDQVEIVWGDIRNSADVSRAVCDVDSILHVAGIIPPAADQNPDLSKSVNVTGTKNLVTAMLQQSKPPKIIFTSSIAVYGDRLKNPYIQVGDPLNPSDSDVYAQTKIDAEKIIQSSGVQWTIFRLCGILVDRLQIQPLMFHMPLETALEWCHVADAGYGLVQALEHNSILGQIFNFGGGQECRTKAKDFLDQMLPMWGLSTGVLPDFAFATRNFHSGYYVDGDPLNQILNFRRKTLQDYFDTMRKRISPFQRILVRSIPQFFIRYWLLKMSEPLKAIKENNENLIQRFYGSREAFEHLLTRETLS
jgi:nucleoside-diphosphate-sugar epimerase